MGSKVDLKVALTSLKSKTDGIIQTLDGNLSELEKRLGDCLDLKKETTTVNEYLANKSQQLLERRDKAIEEKDSTLHMLDETSKFKLGIQKTIASADAVFCEVEILQEKIAVENEMFNVRNEELSNVKKKMMEEIKMKEAVVTLYETFLGIEIKKTEEKSLLFIFKYINKDDHQGFFFKLNVDDKRQYRVPDCQPMLSNLDQLVSALNETNDLKRFICKMRKEFCKMATN